MIDVGIVGAGVAGLSAAGRLRAAGLSVVVVDKGRGVGGRLATRRIGGARLDHGAQFFTSRTEGFEALSRRWVDDGVAREWNRGFGPTADGHPRYIGSAGMTSMAKDLASGLDVRVGTVVESIEAATGGWTLRCAAPAEPLPTARAVLVTSPVPQTLALLSNGGVTLGAAATDALATIRYDPTFAALVVLDAPSSVPAPGGVQQRYGLLSWIGDNQAKGISTVPALTLHMSPEESARRVDVGLDGVLADMLAGAAEWTGGAGVIHAESVLWLYAQPTVSHDEACLVAVEGPTPLVCAGDAFGQPRVEGAVLSGWAAADAIVDRLCA